EGPKDPVEVIWPLSLRSVTGPLDNGKARAREIAMRTGGVLQWKERVVGTPDQKDRQSGPAEPGHQLLTGRQRTRTCQRAHGGQVGLVIALRLVQLAEVRQIGVVHGSLDVARNPQVAASQAPDGIPRGAVQRGPKQSHQRL